MRCFFPPIHGDIDWSRGWESLDKEFQQVVREGEQGRRYVDKLVKVWAKGGAELWVLIHVEVQTTRDPEFPRRMYVYNYRIDDRYNHQVVSLAVLADDDPDWRPNNYKAERWRCRKRFEFPVAKLLDYAGHETELEASDNPFAKVLLAHLKTLETRGNAPDRQLWKVRLVRGLFERGFSAEQVRQLFRLIDWLMDLPPALNRLFWDEVKQIQEERKMPFITTPERIGREDGPREGLLKAVALGLKLKFGAEGQQLFAGVSQEKDVTRLQAIYDAIEGAATLEDVRRVASH